MAYNGWGGLDGYRWLRIRCSWHIQPIRHPRNKRHHFESGGPFEDGGGASRRGSHWVRQDRRCELRLLLYFQVFLNYVQFWPGQQRAPLVTTMVWIPSRAYTKLLQIGTCGYRSIDHMCVRVNRRLWSSMGLRSFLHAFSQPCLSLIPLELDPIIFTKSS